MEHATTVPSGATSGNVVVYASGVNSNGSSFTVTVPAQIVSADHVAFTVGTAGTFTVAATGSPTPTLSETGSLPSGVTFNTSTGQLGGTPASGTAGTYAVTFTAHNGAGSDANQSFTLTVNSTGPTVYYYLGDVLGTARVITTSTGTVCYDADFYPYGGERTPYTNNCSVMSTLIWN